MSEQTISDTNQATNLNLPPGVQFVERGWLNSNMIIIHGDHPVVIDTGHEVDAQATVDLLPRYGVDPARIGLIGLTHCHWDHHGANARLHALSGAPVAMGARTAELFRTEDRRAMWMSYFGQEATLVQPEIVWEPGTTIQLNGWSFEVWEAAGHAMDGIALYQPDYKTLICGDALLEGDFGIMNVAVHGWDVVLDAAEATLQRFLAHDITLALPGHGPAVAAVHGNAQLLLRRLAQFRRSPARLARHLCRRVFMVYLMTMSPINRAALIDYVIDFPWVADYLPMLGSQDFAATLDSLLDEYVAGGVAEERDGVLYSRLAR